LLELLAPFTIISVCPEKEAGLGVPRQPMEVKGGQMVRRDGKKVTEQVRQGIKRCLQQIEDQEVIGAVLKDQSPTCGCGQIYDGSFSGTLITGDGWLTLALKKRGIACWSAEAVVEKPSLLEKSRNVFHPEASNDGMFEGKLKIRKRSKRD